MELISRQAALAQGLTYYFTGVACSKGHISRRLAKSATCDSCRSEDRANRKYYLSEAAKEAQRQYRRANPQIQMLESARHRAKEKGIAFSISAADIPIPETCPVLGIPLFCGEGSAIPNSPTIDRIIPALGYVPGNVRVISHRANTIKNDATEEELLLVVRYIRESVAH